MATGLFPSQQAHGAPGGHPNPAQMGPYNPLKSLPPLRTGPYEKDSHDGARIAYHVGRYAAQTDVLMVRDRQIEYNVRMVCGQHWNVWHPTLGRFFDVQEWLTDDEKRWRQLPVINKLLRWFIVTHARMTENQPILTWLPGPDRLDSELADVLDTLFKLDWRRSNMEAVHDELMMWLILAGRSHALSRIDLTKGEWTPWIANSPLPILDVRTGQLQTDMNGQPVMTPQMFPNVPLGPDGFPRMVMTPDGPQQTGEPHMERQGGVAVDAYSPLQVRGQWGPQLWHMKRWHAIQRFLTPEEVFEMCQVEVEPDISAQDASNMAILERVLFGAGYFGAALGRLGTGWADSRAKGPLCTVYESWEAPLPFDERLIGTWAEPMMQTPTNPGGRHFLCTPRIVIKDTPRDIAWPYVSPIRTFDFVRVAGRPSGTTPVEMLIGPQRSYNKLRSQQLEHAALLGNPQMVVDQESGIQPGMVTNEPGKIYTAVKRPGVTAVEYVIAPPLGVDVYKAMEFAAHEIDELGQLEGTEGRAPTQDASGELVKELRFNSDRFLGPTARRAVGEYARMAEDWRVLYPRIYTAEQIIVAAGEDRMSRTITVMPMLFEGGNVNVQPDAESMIPEGRGERQSRAHALWLEGAWGPPDSPEARDVFLSQARFPNYGRLSMPGGIDRETAEIENGQFLAGAMGAPVAEWYDDMVHLMVHEKYMKSREFLKLDPRVQQVFIFHRMQHVLQLQAKMAQQLAQQVEQEAAIAGARGEQQPGGAQESKSAQPNNPKGPKSAGGKSPTAKSTPRG